MRTDIDLLRRKASRTLGAYEPDALFETLSPEARISWLDRLPAEHGHPIAVFAIDDGWTALTDRFLVTGTPMGVLALPLDDLGNGYEVSAAGSLDAKAHLDRVRFPGSEIWFRAPTAGALSHLLNVLQVVFQANERALTREAS